MNERASIVNIDGDHEETVLQLAKHLGRGKIRRQIFDTVYGRGTLPKSKKQIMKAAGLAAAGTMTQQVQNELDHLAKHHLIVKLENPGLVKDGSRLLYQKDPTVRAIRDRIVKFADNKKAAEKVPTKRRPAFRGGVMIRSVSVRELKKKRPLSVLYLSANPSRRHPLRVEAEMKRVQEAIRGSKYRDNVELHYRPAADLHSLIDGLNDHRPQIVHFSGHGNSLGVATDTGSTAKASTKAVSFELLAKALAATDDPPEIILLNSCESSGAKKALIPPAKIIITMRVSVTDAAAAAFAIRFYAAIASGQSVKAAFEQGKVAVEAVSISESGTPELSFAHDVNPATKVLT
jgi:hypothetical protein